LLDTPNWYDHTRNLAFQFVPLVSWYVSNVWAASSRTVTLADFFAFNVRIAQSAAQHFEVVSETAVKRVCLARFEAVRALQSKQSCCTKFKRLLCRCCCPCSKCTRDESEGDEAFAALRVDYGTLLTTKYAVADDDDRDDDGNTAEQADEASAHDGFARRAKASGCCRQICSQLFYAPHYALIFFSYPSLFDERDRSFINTVRVMAVLGSKWFFFGVFTVYQFILQLQMRPPPAVCTFSAWNYTAPECAGGPTKCIYTAWNFTKDGCR
jgi:hypothetical protein